MDINRLIVQLENAKREGVKEVIISTNTHDIIDDEYYDMMQDIVSRTIVGETMIYNCNELNHE